MNSQPLYVSACTCSTNAISSAPSSVLFTVICELLEQAVASTAPLLYLVHLLLFPMPTVGSFVDPLFAVVTPSLELLRVLLIFLSLSFVLAFLLHFPFALFFSLALAVVLDASNLHGELGRCSRHATQW